MDKKGKNASSLSFIMAAVSILFCIVNFVKVMLQNDEATGLLKNSGLTTAFNWALFVGILIILAIGALITRKIYKPLIEKNTKKTMLLGISMIVAAFCFIIQGSMDIISTLSAWRIEVISLLTSVMSLLAGVAFALRGFEMIQLAPKSHFALYIFPVAWATISLLNLILTYPMYVSYQSLTEKLLSAVFSLLLLFCISKKELGYNSEKNHFFGMFMIVVASGILIASDLPFGLASVLGVRDITNNTPHLAYFGLAVYGFVAMLSYVFTAETKKEQKTE